ncbi:hypothetical protein Aperf_G00000121885 [Anoplocephala perfoliata]
MICDDSNFSSALDKPKHFEPNECVLSPAEEIVAYSCSPDRNIWSKTVNLEKCDRFDLSSLLTFVSYIQQISPTRMFATVDTNVLRNNIRFGLYLPISIFLNGSDLTFLYPFSKSGSVHDLLQPHYIDGGLSETIVQAIFSRAVHGLNQLHKNGWTHRSICARHILLYQQNSEKDALDVAFCGLGSIIPAGPFGSPLNRTDLPVIDAGWRGWHYQNLRDANYSTHPVAWYSPEMVSQDFEGYGKPADIYSLGLTLAEMFTGIAPFVGTITPSLIFLKKMTLKEPLQLPVLLGGHIEHGGSSHIFLVGMTKESSRITSARCRDPPCYNVLQMKQEKLDGGEVTFPPSSNPEIHQKPPGQTASAEMLSIFESCTHFDPNQRPTTEELLENAWIQRGLSTPLRESQLAALRLH